MSLFICPLCDGHSELTQNNDKTEFPFICPHCGQEFKIDKDLNYIAEK